MEGETHKLGDSKFQRDIEALVIPVLQQRFGPKNTAYAKKVPLGESFCNVDFVDINKNIFCEVYACGSTLKPAQKYKVKNDILKLIAIERTAIKPIEKYLVLTIHDGDKTFDSLVNDDRQEYETLLFGTKTWLRAVIKMYGIKLLFYNLSPSGSEELSRRRENQSKGNQKKTATEIF